MDHGHALFGLYAGQLGWSALCLRNIQTCPALPNIDREMNFSFQAFFEIIDVKTQMHSGFLSPMAFDS